MAETRRIAAIYLPHWPVERFCRAGERADKNNNRDTALVLAMPMQGGVRITAATSPALAQGVEPGQRLADALALCPNLIVRDTDFAADRTGLKKLADWCGRYTPWTAPDPVGLTDEPDGIVMDISGCAHLFGGEAALIDDLAGRLAGFHLSARITVAATPGAAWALARFGGAPLSVLPSGKEKEALAPLPVPALRLPGDVADGLARLGLKRIGDLYDRARAPLTARFGRMIALRLDEALGHAMEPISPERPLVPYRVRSLFAEGLTRIEDIETATAQLADELCALLEREHKGARQLELLLFRVDGEVTRLRAGTSAPTRTGPHLARLFREKFEQAGDDFDAGFGIEAMSLAALVVEPLHQTQTAMTDDAARACDIDGLMDRLGNRLGVDRVTRLVPHASHLPERAARHVAVLRGGNALPAQDWRVAALQHCDGAVTRPLRMLAAPEPVEVTAEIPEGPPRRFRWRRILYQVARAEGPERIAPEWWRNARDRTRDYYRVEDIDGHRFWLFRDGLYERDDAPPRWFIQGLF